jgi:hypothetical protein
VKRREETKKQREDREWKDRETCEMLGVNSLSDIPNLPNPVKYREWPEAPWLK